MASNDRKGPADTQVITGALAPVRLFKKLETLVAYLKGLGLVSFVVDAEKFELPGACLPPKKPRCVPASLVKPRTA